METAFHMSAHERLEKKIDQLLTGQTKLEGRIVALEVRAGLIGSLAGSIFGAVVGSLGR